MKSAVSYVRYVFSVHPECQYDTTALIERVWAMQRETGDKSLHDPETLSRTKRRELAAERKKRLH